MARYSLILADSVFKTLYDKATEQQISMGKLFNKILIQYASLGEVKEIKEIVKEIKVAVYPCCYCLETFNGAVEARKHIEKCPLRKEDLTEEKLSDKVVFK
jgi:hypothetical protein